MRRDWLSSPLVGLQLPVGKKVIAGPVAVTTGVVRRALLGFSLRPRAPGLPPRPARTLRGWFLRKGRGSNAGRKVAETL